MADISARSRPFIKGFHHGLLASIFCIWSVAEGAFGEAIDRLAVEGRLGAFANTSVKYDITEEVNMDPAVASHLAQLAAASVDAHRLTSGHELFEMRGSNARLEHWVSPETASYWAEKRFPFIEHQLQAISKSGRLDELTDEVSRNGKKQTIGGISQLASFPEGWTIDIALGLRLYRTRSFLTIADLEKAKEGARRPDGLYEITLKGDNGLDNHLCFDPGNLYALVSYRCDLSHGAIEEVENSDFRVYGNLAVPERIVRRTVIADSSGHQRYPITHTLQVNDYQFDDALQQDSAEIVWPAHLKLYDARIHGPVDVGARSRRLSDNDIRLELKEQEEKEDTAEQRARDRIERLLGSSTTASTTAPAP
jgi:hypothetical protein